MRQVPDYLIIGNGRVARHLLHYFSLIGIERVAQWHRGEDEARLHERAAAASHILLAVSDSAIEPLADKLKDAPGIKIHFSGSLVTDKAHGAHPLMTFTPQLYALEKYLAIPFVVDEDAPAFSALLPGLSNPHHRLPKKDKAKYHALCVMAGNFSCILWQKLFDGLAQEFGLPPATANMYLRQQTDNLLADYQNALTGPLARGDNETIARNLKALEGDAFQPVYQAFVKAYPLIKQGTLKEKAS
ncbi:MAG: DUF2520 domain-containing protein [Alphaproteobacteria bacterium]|nr:DUF2520 domain-containing protein [Alphaproteobacteria bacterium]